MEIFNDVYHVYAHINKINGKIYVGQTCQNPKERWDNGRGYKGCTYFYNAIQKYGWNSFEHEIIASNLTKEEADNFEKLLIDKLNLLDQEYGYNLREGGSHGHISEDTKQKMRDSQSGEKHHMYGKHLPEETKKKISKAKSGEKNHFYGKQHSDESKQKISEANSGYNNRQSKAVYQYDLQENLIKEWESMTSVADAYNVGRTTVMRYCRSGKLFLDKFILKLEKVVH